MARYGFIKTKEDIKFLILYALCYLPEPAQPLKFCLMSVHGVMMDLAGLNSRRRLMSW